MRVRTAGVVGVSALAVAFALAPTASPALAPTASPALAPTASPALAPTASPALAPTASRALASQQRPELPEEVKTWLERDQVQRWAGLLRTGQTLFDEGSCTRCHGDGGIGGPRGPDLTDAQWVQSDGSLEGIRETIMWGVRRRDFADDSRPFEMNPAGGMNVEWDELSALAAYVWSLNNGTFLPGR